MAKKIALVYLITGVIWITFSDWALHEIAMYIQLSDNQISALANWKGYFYIFVTSHILFWYLRRFLNKKSKTEKQFRRLFDENPNPMWFFDTQTLQLLAVNQATVEEYGYSREEFSQMTIKDIRPQESLYALEKRLAESIQSYSKSGIWCHQRKNGELFYVRIYSNATEYNGRKSRLVMAFDISAVIQAEQENKVLTNSLAKKERYLRSLIQSQTTFLIRTDIEGRYTFANRSYYQKINYSSESIIGETFIKNSSP